MKKVTIKRFIVYVGTTTDGKEVGFIQAPDNFALTIAGEDTKEQFLDLLANYDGKDGINDFIERKNNEEVNPYKDFLLKIYFTPNGNNLCGDFSYQDGKVMYKGIEVEKAAEEAANANEEEAKGTDGESAKSTSSESSTKEAASSISFGSSKDGEAYNGFKVKGWMILLGVIAFVAIGFLVIYHNKSSDTNQVVEAVQNPASTNNLLADNKTAKEQDYIDYDEPTEEEASTEEDKDIEAPADDMPAEVSDSPSKPENTSDSQADNSSKADNTSDSQADNSSKADNSTTEADIIQRLAGYYKSNDMKAIKDLVKKGTKENPFGGTQLYIDDEPWPSDMLLDINSINYELDTKSIIYVDKDDNGKLKEIRIG